MASREDLKTLVRKMRAQFVVPPEEGLLSELDSTSAELSPDYQIVADAFRHNLRSLLATVAMPFTLASTGVSQKHFQRIYGAESIRALDIEDEALQPGENLEEVRRRTAHEKATLRMQEFGASKDGSERIITDTCDFLLASLKDGLEYAAQELLLQGTVLLWSAFEVLFRDTLELFLNHHPARIKALASHPSTRRRFESEKLSLHALAEYDFAISNRMGTILLRGQDFSDLPVIKSACSVLFPDEQLAKVLANPSFWLLYQNRHLIVHRRGIVDRIYLDNTGEDLQVGSRLVITPESIERYLEVVIAAVIPLWQYLRKEDAVE